MKKLIACLTLCVAATTANATAMSADFHPMTMTVNGQAKDQIATVHSAQKKSDMALCIINFKHHESRKYLTKVTQHKNSFDLTFNIFDGYRNDIASIDCK